VTHLPGGLTQLNFNGSGNATYLGDYTGSATRIQDNQGNFGTTGDFSLDWIAVRVTYTP